MFEWLKNKFGKKDEEVKKDNISEKEETQKSEESIEESSNFDSDLREQNEEISEKDKIESQEVLIEEDLNDIKLDNEVLLNTDDLKEESKIKTEDIIVEEILDEEKISETEVIVNEEPMKTEVIKVDTEIDNEEKKEIEEINPVEQSEVQEKKKPSLFQRLKDGLDKTRKEVGIKINTVLGAYVKIDDEMLEDIEDILISADIGMQTTMQLVDNLRETIIRNKVNDPKEVKPLLMEEAKKLMNPELNTKIKSDSPTIILVVGVNGVGKTTTIGKLSARFKNENKSVLVCAADTFRAAAIDQLKEWGNRANVDIISHEEGSDPASVVFDAIAAAKARNTDVLIVDTAGRLHNKANLMKELEKINKIIDKNYPEANRENLLVLDATTGQNAMNQAKTFKEATDLTGIALTKLDGTAKGGVVIALQSELEIPIKLVGVGEGINDLQDFDIDNFIEAIFN